jgi:hypothetical protein
MHGRVLQFTENVQAYGAKGDGSTDDSAAILAAVDAITHNATSASGDGGGQLLFPPGDYVYASSTPLSCYRYTQLTGASAGSSRIKFTGSAGLTFPGGTHHFGMRDLALINTGTADVVTFPEGDYVANALFLNCSFEQTKTNKHILYGASNASLVFDRFISCDFIAAAGATVHPISISSSSNSNCNTWQHCLFQANGGSAANNHFFFWDNINASGYNYQINLRDIAVEGGTAGYIRILSAYGCTIDSIAGFDPVGAATGDLIVIGQHGGGQSSKYCNVSNVFHNGSLAGSGPGKYMVNTSGSRLGTLDTIEKLIHLDTPSYIRIRNSQGGFDGGPPLSNEYVDSNAYVYMPAGLNIPTKAGVITDVDFAFNETGQIAVDTTNSKLYVRVGATWKSVTLT